MKDAGQFALICAYIGTLLLTVVVVAYLFGVQSPWWVAIVNGMLFVPAGVVLGDRWLNRHG